MCFGNTETGRRETTSNQTSTQTSTANPAVANAATSNLDFATRMRDLGFTPYGGEQVANFSPLQGRSFDMARGIAGDSTATGATNLINRYAYTDPSKVKAGTIDSRMSPYMNQYVMQALAPQMYQMDVNDANQRKSLDAAATSSNAFGDARTGIERANLEQVLGINRAGVIGQAYDRAFNTAIGAGAQDVANDLSAQNTNASLTEQALNRALGGSVALQNLQNQQMGIAKSVNEFGQQQTAQEQAKLNALYNQWLMAQQFPFQTLDAVNKTTATGAAAMPAGVTQTKNGTETRVDSAPNNSGWGMLGTVLGAALAPMTGGLSLAGMVPGIMGAIGGGAGGGTGYATNPWSSGGMFGGGNGTGMNGGQGGGWI